MPAESLDGCTALMQSEMKKAIFLAVSVATLLVGFVAAQPNAGPRAPDGAEGSRPVTDPEVIVRPPPTVDPRLTKPAPRNIDPGLVEKPPADANPGNSSKSRPQPSTRSRQDDCRGSAADCKQNSAR